VELDDCARQHKEIVGMWWRDTHSSPQDVELLVWVAVVVKLILFDISFTNLELLFSSFFRSPMKQMKSPLSPIEGVKEENIIQIIQELQI